MGGGLIAGGVAAGAVIGGGLIAGGVAAGGSGVPATGKVLCATRGAPQALQNFIPTGFLVLHFSQMGSALAEGVGCDAGVAGDGCAGAACARGVPQAWQKRKPSGFSFEQFGQTIIRFFLS